MSIQSIGRAQWQWLTVAAAAAMLGATACSNEAPAAADTATAAPAALSLTSSPLTLKVLANSCGANQAQHFFQITNTGPSPIRLSDISIKLWVDDTTGQAVVPHISTGGCVSGAGGNPSCVHQAVGVAAAATSFAPACGADATHQADWEITISNTDTATMPPGAVWNNIESSLNLTNFGNFVPGTGAWFSPCVAGGGGTYVADPHFALYFQGNLVFSNGLTTPSCRSPQGARSAGCNHVVANAPLVPAAGPVPQSTQIALAIGLPLRNLASLQSFNQQVSDPASPTYRQYLTVPQFADQFGATTADYQAIVQWAIARGLTVKQYPNRLLVDVVGTVAQLEQAFFTNFVYGQRPDGTLFYEPDRCPTADFPAAVDFVGGLDNFQVPRPQSTVGTAPDGNFRSQDLRSAYLGGACAGFTGAGQIIGLVEFDGFSNGTTAATNDIVTYENTTGLTGVPNATFQLLDNFSGNPSGTGGSGECAGDIEMALAMAPGAQVIAVEGTQLDSILSALATTPGLSQISDSWANADDGAQKFLYEFTAQGQSFFMSSGDAGAYQADGMTMCGTGTPPPFVDASPTNLRGFQNVTVVGGTVLTTDAAESYGSETAWPGSGGGVVNMQTLPDFQVGTAGLVSGTNRNDPDVSMPATGLYSVSTGCKVPLACSVPLTATGQCPGTQSCPIGQLAPATPSGFGGTSASAPLWAGFMALMNQQAKSHGLNPVGFPNELFYKIARLPVYASAFHDVKDGSTNPNACGTKFTTAAGWDAVTGLGSPQCGLLAAALSMASPPAVTITLSNLSFKTSGGNLFNCVTGGSQTPRPISGEDANGNIVLTCTPQRNTDGSISTTPVNVTAQEVSCGDGHGALITASCNGSGIPGRIDIDTTVSISIEESCGAFQQDSDNFQAFVATGVIPGQPQSGSLESCDVFTNICATGLFCSFNDFTANVSVSNSGGF